MVLALTPIAAHASSPTITLSASSGYGDGQTAGIQITGTGFPQLKSGTGIQLYFISTSKTLSVSGATAVNMYGQSLTLNSPPAHTVTVDANGNFIAYFDTPALPGDTYNVFVTYTPTSGSQTNSAPVTFQITPYLDIRLANDLGTSAVAPTTRSAHWGQWVAVRVYGFGASESVTVTGLPVLGGTTVSVNTDANGDNSAYTFVQLLGETTGGQKTFTGVGQSSGLTATRTFTFEPTIVLYSSTGATTLSVPATAPATTYLALHGFANAETISAATVGGVTASMGSVTTNSDGSYGGGAGSHLALLYSNSLPFGATTITLTGSTTGTVTFNAANGNVYNPYGKTALVTGTMSLQDAPILASTSQTSGTALVGLSETSGFVGDTLGLYLTGWDSGVGSIAATFAGASQTLTCGSSTIDTNGADICTFTVPNALRGPQTVAVTTASGPTNPGTTFTVNPLLQFYTYNTADDAAGMAAFTNSGSSGSYGYVSVSGTGFGATSSTTEVVSLSIGTTVISSTFVTPSASGSSIGSFSQQVIDNTGLPDLAAGTYQVTSAGATTGDNATGVDYYSYNTLGTTVTDLTVVGSFGLTSSMSVTAGSSVNTGQTIVLQTTSTAGIHGLAASAAYQVYLDGPSGTMLTSFTSTSSGNVPAGVQVTIPAGTSSGVHIIDFVQNGASVIIGQTVNVKSIDNNGLDESTYGQLYITVAGTITVSPSAGSVGSTVTLSGSGLTASQGYTVQLNGITYASFTTTSSGAIPTGVTFAFPAISTTTETGTSETLDIVNSATSNTDATAIFLLQAGATVAPTSTGPGGQVKMSANGLQASTGYNIVWNAALNSNGLTQGTIIGSFVTHSDGTGSANFTVPSTASPGSYPVSLILSSKSLGGSGVTFTLVTAPVVTVGASAGTGACTGTSCFAASGTASQVTTSQGPALSVSFTNTASGSVTAFVYAVVHNAAGQTVYYTTATISPAGGATATAQLLVAGLPSGTYSVTYFAVSSTGSVISSTGTATVTV